jgi:predicted NUDIX family phosphoesterase
MWDEAGFVDNDFRGDVVFEVTPMEAGGMALKSNAETPATNLEFFRTSKVPDKLYGKEIGSNYQNQSGPRVSKHFGRFNFAYAAKNYQKLKRNVLVHDAKVLLGFRGLREGFEPLTPKNRQSMEALLEEIESEAFFHSRYDCEDDTLVLQIIPYVPVFSPDRKVFTYVRAKKIEHYGDTRLFGKHSIGLGGHIRKSDRPHYIRECIAREVTREEVEIRGEYSEPKLVGTIMAYNEPVDAVHLGLVYVIHASGEVVAREPSITSFGMQPIRKLVRSNPRLFETWSRILIPLLPDLYKL